MNSYTNDNAHTAAEKSNSTASLLHERSHARSSTDTCAPSSGLRQDESHQDSKFLTSVNSQISDSYVNLNAVSQQNQSADNSDAIAFNSTNALEDRVSSDMQMKAIANFNRQIHLPGSILYIKDRHQVILNPYAVKYLGYPPSFTEKRLDADLVLAHLGKRLSKLVLKKLSTIQLPIPCFAHSKCKLRYCPLQKPMSERLSLHCPALSNHATVGGTNRVFFEIVSPRGQYRGSRFYCKAVGIFARNKQTQENELSTISLIISRVSSLIFDRLPHSVEDRGCFDWFLPTDHIRYNSNYYQVFGYNHHDPRVPTTIENWVRSMVHQDDHQSVQHSQLSLNFSKKQTVQDDHNLAHTAALTVNNTSAEQSLLDKQASTITQSTDDKSATTTCGAHTSAQNKNEESDFASSFKLSKEVDGNPLSRKALFYDDRGQNISPNDGLAAYAPESLNQSKGVQCFEQFFRIRRADNTFVWTKAVGVVVGSDPQTGQPSRILGVNININRVVDSFESLRNKVFTDILTGLKNRNFLISHIEHYMLYKCQPLSIIFTDITGLKVYNDYLNHSVGDKLLCMAADLLRVSITREHDLIRVSGDEIVCILPNCNKEALYEVKEQIYLHLREYNSKAPVRMPVLFSIGSATIDYRPLFDMPLDLPDKSFSNQIFQKALVTADLRMQENKRHNKKRHYALIRAYIENRLNRKIVIKDARTSAS